MKKRFLALLLVGCLLIVLGACQTEQDELYSRAVEDQKAQQASSLPRTQRPGLPGRSHAAAWDGFYSVPMMICRGSW